MPATGGNGSSSLLETPQARDGKGAPADGYNAGGPGQVNGRGIPDSLPAIEQLLPTPTASISTGPGSGGRDGGLNLQTQVDRLMQTPSAADALGGHLNRGGARSGELLLKGQMREAGPAGNFGPYRAAVERWAVVLGRPAPPPVNAGRLNPRFVEWMMGLPEGHVTDLPNIPNSAALKALGNGVVPQQAALALTLLDPR